MTLSLAQSTNPAPYCDASFDDMQGFMVDDHVNSVSFGSLNNASNGQFAAPHYVFYNNLNTATFNRGSSYTLSVNFTTAGGCGYGVWIDYNQNNTFEASEKVAGTTGTAMLAVGSTPTVTQSVTIPGTAMTGSTRMRIRIVEDDNYHITTTNELPCNASSSATDVMDWGETEDYTINIASTVGIAENSIENKFTIAPNPVSTLLNINTGIYGSVSYSILNILGKEVQTGTLRESAFEINTASLPEGLYFLRLSRNNGSIQELKFVKKNP